MSERHFKWQALPSKLTASPGFIPKRSKIRSALRYRCSGTRALNKMEVSFMAQMCSDWLTRQDLKLAVSAER